MILCFHCDVQGAVGAVRDGLADAVDLRLGYNFVLFLGGKDDLT